MAKSLGQIHTVSYETDATLAQSDTKYLIDLPGQLTEHLQHMVRMMNSFKLVGMDFSIQTPTGTPDPVSGSMLGKVYYYTPTEGRVEALKMAYQSVRRMMKLSGVDPTHAITYDFRPPIWDPADFENGDDFLNQASIEDNGLATCLANGPGSSNIFGLYNQGIVPRQDIGASTFFEEGFEIGLRSNPDSADWVLNEGIYLQSLTAPLADETLEEIPWSVAFNSDSSFVGSANNWNWRPDPALYLSILTGQLIVELDEVDVQAGEEDEILLAMSFHVAGWKSILRHDKRKRRTSKKGGKRHGRKRHSKK